MTRSVLVAALGLLALAGCSKGPALYPVTGRVTWNGESIPEGTINFIAEDHAVAPDTARIVNGQYDARVRAGRKKIEVYAHREKKTTAVMGQKARESYIPPKYNALSTMIREVTPAGENRFDFALTDKD
jgi:hypothetical protein